MTERHTGSHEPEDDYDHAIDHIVDAWNFDYDTAREFLGDRPSEETMSEEPNTLTYADTSPFHGPFREQTTQLLDHIATVEYRSQLAPNQIGSKIARLATSLYEIDALNAAVQNHREQLTYSDTESPEEG
jgi:hypothetical protein